MPYTVEFMATGEPDWRNSTLQKCRIINAETTEIQVLIQELGMGTFALWVRKSEPWDAISLNAIEYNSSYLVINFDFTTASADNVTGTVITKSD